MSERPARTPLVTSNLPPHLVSLHRGEPPQVACPVCGRWRLVKRRRLWPHRGEDGVSRCPGSNTPVVINERPRQWEARCETARLHTEGLRGGLWSGRPMRPDRYGWSR